MHAYGYSRNAKISCCQGCCQRKDAFREAKARIKNDRSRRKAARQLDNRKIFTELLNAE
jgi:hypothetical protein